jgi:tripartite-type tricarboxylate transporter receptor subunit TctC
MKKILLVVLLSILPIVVIAAENITIVYSWSAADAAANFWRYLADSANKQQKKYNFIVDYRPGAGGTVATQHISNTQNTIQATSSAFYIRANLYPNESYDLNKFQSVLPLCLAPISISSSKYKSWDEVPKGIRLTIGISGLGTTTHLAAIQITQKYPKMEIIPFKSTSEAVQATLSDQIDFAVGFVGDSIQYQGNNITNKQSYILGISGTKSINGKPLLTNQGFPKVLSIFGVPAQAVAPITMPDSKYNEIRQILLAASKDKKVVDIQEVDYCFYNAEMSEMSPDKFYSQSRDIWKKLTSGVKIE